MESKNLIKAAVFFLFFLPFGLIAENGQTANAAKPELKKNYFIKENEDGLMLIQRLSWENIEDILAYDVNLEQKDKTGKWQNIDKKRVKENYLDVSLPPGNYRYKVTVINLLEQPDVQSEYRYFDIRIAYQPEVSSVSPRTIHFDDIYDEFVTVSGKNFYGETVFSLSKSSGAAVRGEVAELDDSGTKAKIKFNMNKIQPGEYDFTVTDISGLSDKSKKMTFKFQKPVDFYISAGYAFSGFIQNSTFKEYFNANFAALGGVIRLTTVPIKRAYGTFGINLTGSGMYLKHKEEIYTLTAGYILTQLNAVYLLPIIRHTLNFDLHIGGGAAFLVNPQFVFTGINATSEKAWFWGLTVNGGTALQVYLVKKLYLEINLDHIIAFKKGFPLYTIQPSLSLGWEF